MLDKFPERVEPTMWRQRKLKPSVKWEESNLVAGALIGSTVHGVWNALVEIVGGALATVVNAVEHGR
ncbi:hypothetical protein QJS04_geneDACA013248 [Acorus gramineus]|uniref:Uncharacterized protein n=1 Tax=Acorus gramineus TaxID=55184 RepID=A0AAV9BC39_ACOGR|nr:hypothetical protein QJS04_geneDACA013248 [Acorus gramineus]